jgi:hypothetical protein
MLPWFDRIVFGITGFVVVVGIVLGCSGCGMLITQGLKTGVKTESCMLERRVKEDVRLTPDEKALRVEMCRNNRELVGVSLDCGETGL